MGPAGGGGERGCARPTIIVDVTRSKCTNPSGRADAGVSSKARVTLSLIYFNNPGWAKKGLPLGQLRTVSGKLEAYGDEWQIIHPEVSEPGKGPPPALREPVYPLTEGITNRRMGELAALALERAPELPEWIERALPRGRLAPWRALAEASLESL